MNAATVEFFEKVTNASDATDPIFDRIDDLLLAGQFNVVNEILSQTSDGELSGDDELSLLTITFAARDKLPARAALYRKCFDAAVAAHGTDYANQLLVGLG